MPHPEIYLNKMEHDSFDPLNDRVVKVQRLVNANLQALINGNDDEIHITHFHWLSMANPELIAEQWKKDEENFDEREFDRLFS